VCITQRPHYHHPSTALQPVVTLSTITALEATDATQGAWDEHTQCSCNVDVVQSLGERWQSISVGVQIRQAETQKPITTGTQGVRVDIMDAQQRDVMDPEVPGNIVTLSYHIRSAARLSPRRSCRHTISLSLNYHLRFLQRQNAF
jgi:hypothetical protein